MVFDVAMLYANYVSNDAPFGKISGFLIKDSSLYNSLRTMEVYWYTKHTSFAFKNMKSDNYIKYDDNCFSCHVSFDYYVYRGNKEYNYPSRYTFILLSRTAAINWAG